MTSYLLAGPVAEPVSLAEAKAFLKLDEGIEDALITTLIGAARLHVEGITGRALMAQSWRVVLDDSPETGFVKLPVSPIIMVTAVTATDTNGASHDVPLGQFSSEGDRLLVPRVVVDMPSLQERQGIEIDYVAGFSTEAEEVPADLRQAMLGLVAHWFERRDAVIVAGSGAVVPSGFDRLVSQHKRVRL
ncbi:phage head-tail connector protein [Devosia sp. PTR5]|uniref:Phage head-tail connector protein n=1 Tax=Devosia oryzisoli TaxID=2774138 RepID=A0A927FU00_9HYPH|nr:head-tail connector protein [Devosia oryzisoli]MBD8065337.1 phage head-tail connector protein [Devosia oryzisoli]